MKANKIRTRFEKLQADYSAKRTVFKEYLVQLSASGYTDYVTRGNELVAQGDQLIAHLRPLFSVSDEQLDHSTIKPLLKKLKKIIYEMNETMKPEWRQWIEAFLKAAILVFILRNFFFGLYHVPTGSAEDNMLVGDRVLGNKLIYRLYATPKRGDLVMFEDPEFRYDRSNIVNYMWQKYIGIQIPLLGLSDGPINVVKRIIAAPGDTIEGRLENGKPVIYLNNKLLNEPYLNPYPLIGLEKKTGFFDFDRIGFLPVPSFLQKHAKVVFYTYDPTKEFSDQPYYNMSSEEVVLEPGTLRPWLKFPETPTKNQFGRTVDVFGPITLPKGKYWVMGDSRKNSLDSRFWGMLDESLMHGRASLIIYSVDSEEMFWLFELLKNPLSFWLKSIRWNRFFKMLSQEAGNYAEQAPKNEQNSVAAQKSVAK